MTLSFHSYMLSLRCLSLLCVSDGKNLSNLPWDGTNPALQTIQVRNTALRNALLNITDETPGDTPSL